MNSRERAQLRTRLRQVNIEYSALVRNRSAEGRFVQMTALRFERRVIISLLFGGELAEGRMAIARQEKAPVATLFAAESARICEGATPTSTRPPRVWDWLAGGLGAGAAGDAGSDQTAAARADDPDRRTRVAQLGPGIVAGFIASLPQAAMIYLAVKAMRRRRVVSAR